MTDFGTYEASRESSRPIELYEIVMGTTYWRYTSAEDDLTVGGNTFVAESLSRGTIAQGSDQNNRNVVITVPRANEFASLYVDVPPGERATVNIFRYQRDEVPAFDTQVLLFKGQVQSVQFPNDAHNAAITVRSIESALNRNMPRFNFMGMCNHVLYDAACGANPSNFDHLGVATAISDNTVTVSGVAASGLDFVGGYCRPTGTNDFRMVRAQSGDELTLLLPFANSPVGGNVQVFAGCDHVLTGDCALVFDRVADFGGFHYVPSRNIFQTGLD